MYVIWALWLACLVRDWSCWATMRCSRGRVALEFIIGIDGELILAFLRCIARKISLLNRGLFQILLVLNPTSIWVGILQRLGCLTLACVHCVSTFELWCFALRWLASPALLLVSCHHHYFILDDVLSFIWISSQEHGVLCLGVAARSLLRHLLVCVWGWWFWARF